jgi:hypothetical protein
MVARWTLPFKLTQMFLRLIWIRRILEYLLNLFQRSKCTERPWILHPVRPVLAFSPTFILLLSCS